MFSLAAASALALLAPPPVQDAPPAAARQDVPARSAPAVNRTQSNNLPRRQTGPETILPEASRAIGEHGEVHVSAHIGIDGSVSEVKLAQSSRAPTLDRLALDIVAQSVFTPGKDANGNPAAMTITFPLKFDNLRANSRSNGVLSYSCAQFVRDQDWWNATWGDTKEKDDFYSMMLGLAMLSRKGGIAAPGFSEAIEDFRKLFETTIRKCRATPDKLVLDIFKPYGDAFRRMVTPK